jgi:hypothetical protein
MKRERDNIEKRKEEMLNSKQRDKLRWNLQEKLKPLRRKEDLLNKLSKRETSS